MLLMWIAIFLFATFEQAFDSQYNKQTLKRRTQKTPNSIDSFSFKTNLKFQKYQQRKKFDSIPKWQLCTFQADSCPKWCSCFYYAQLFVSIDICAKIKFITLSCPNKCNKYCYWTHDSWWLPPNQFEWHNNWCLCKNYNNDCDNDTFRCKKNCNYKSTTIPAQWKHSILSSTIDNNLKHSASRRWHDSSNLCNPKSSFAASGWGRSSN